MSPEKERREPATGKLFYGWVIALCCTLVTIINGGIFFTFGIFFKPVAFDFGWSRGEFGGNYTAMLVAYAPGAFFAGRLADRYGPRVILLLAALLIVLGYFGCSQTPNLVIMILSYSSIGLGLGATLALPTATIQRWFLKWRGLMVGIVVAGCCAGGLVFTMLANHLITSYDWRTAYLILGIIDGSVIAIAALFLVAEPKMKNLSPFGYSKQYANNESRAYDGGFTSLTLPQAFKTGVFWVITALYILTFMPDFFIKSHVVAHVTDQGITAALGAQGLGLIAAVSVVGRVSMNWVAERIGWIRSLAISNFVASASVIWLVFVTVPWEFYLFVVLYGFFWGSTLALLSGATGAFLGLASLGGLLGFMLGLGVLVGAITPWLGGLSFDLTGNYFIAIAGSASLFGMAGLISLLLKAPPRSQKL